RMLPTGKVGIAARTTPHGQSHVTTFAQIAADDLGIPIDDIEVLYGDTAVAPLGMDTYGSRSLAVGGVAVHRAAQKIVDKARKIAAHELEVAEEDLDYQTGRFSVKGAPDRAKTVAETAFSAWTAHNLPEGIEPGLDDELRGAGGPGRPGRDRREGGDAVDLERARGQGGGRDRDDRVAAGGGERRDRRARPPRRDRRRTARHTGEGVASDPEGQGG